MNAKTTTAPTTTRKSEPRLYKVHDRITGDVIYVNGTTKGQVENFATYRRFAVSVLTVREAVGLKAEDILDATQQPGPPAAVALGK